MKKMRVIFGALLLVQLFLTGCAQDKVTDTELIRLKNNVKDLDLVLKQRTDEAIRMNHKVTGLEETANRQKEQISQLMSASPGAQFQQKHPIVIQDIKVTSEEMDEQGRIWGPFTLNITLYNGTDQPVEDSLSALIINDDPTKNDTAPKVEQMIKKFKLGPSEAKLITLDGLPINHPTKRLNVIVKLLDNTHSPDNEGVPGETTWVVVPTVIFPPKSFP